MPENIGLTVLLEFGTFFIHSIFSSSTSHSKENDHYNITSKVTSTKLQKENNPQDKYKNLAVQKTVKISVVNDLKKNVTNANSRLSVEVNVASNKKVVKASLLQEKTVVEITETPEYERKAISESLDPSNETCDNIPSVQKDIGNTEDINDIQDNRKCTADDYKSPLDAFGDTS